MMKKIYIMSLLVAALVVASCSRDESTAVEKTEVKRLPDQEIWDFQVKTTNKGVLEAFIQAGHMRQYAKESLALFDEGVQIDFYDENGEHASRLTADGGEYDDDTQDVKAIGNVVVVSDSGITLYTDELYYYRDKDKIISDKPVKVETEQGHILHGIGFESDTNMNYWEIRQPYDGVAPRGVDLSLDRFEKKEKPDSAAADSVATDTMAIDATGVAIDSTAVDTSMIDTLNVQ